ncbi:MAG: hypothetical protein WCJ30_17010 [Deltaproteobacteria bacterium]
MVALLASCASRGAAVTASASAPVPRGGTPVASPPSSPPPAQGPAGGPLAIAALTGAWRAGPGSALRGLVVRDAASAGDHCILDLEIQCPSDPCPAYRPRGRCTLEGSTLRFDSGSDATRSWNIAREGDALLLTVPDATVVRLERAARYCLADDECRGETVPRRDCPGAVGCESGGRCEFRCGPSGH